MATPQFIARHYRPTVGNAGGRTYSLQFFIRDAQRALANGLPGDAGPCNRNATLDARRRHLEWMQREAFLSQLADHRATK